MKRESTMLCRGVGFTVSGTWDGGTWGREGSSPERGRRPRVSAVAQREVLCLCDTGPVAVSL